MTLVSVVIPAFDATPFLERALDSVALQQEATAGISVIVVDDGSADATAEEAAAHPTRPEVVRLDRNQGPGGARNRGVAASTGEYLVFLDSDDQLPPGSIALRQRVLDSNPGVAGVLGRIRWPAPSARLVDAGHQPGTEHWGAHFGGLMMRRTQWMPIDESYRIGEDIDWFLRAIEQGLELRRLDAAVYEQWHRDDSLTEGATKIREGIGRAIRESHVRRRRLGVHGLPWVTDLPVADIPPT